LQDLVTGIPILTQRDNNRPRVISFIYLYQLARYICPFKIAQGLLSEKILSDSRDRVGLPAKLVQMVSNIQRRTTEENAIRKRVPDNFAEAEDIAVDFHSMTPFRAGLCETTFKSWQAWINSLQDHP
jgi:hypothetical protein